MGTPDDPPVRQIGRLRRPHGVRGELTAELLTDRFERFDVGASVRVGDVWQVIAASRRLPDRWLIRLDGVDDRTAAQRLAGALLYAIADEAPDAAGTGDDGALWVHQLIGAAVVDQHGVRRGTCVAVVDNPAHDLLELEDGALVPVVFITDRTEQVIHVTVPDGLFD